MLSNRDKIKYGLIIVIIILVCIALYMLYDSRYKKHYLIQRNDSFNDTNKNTNVYINDIKKFIIMRDSLENIQMCLTAIIVYDENGNSINLMDPNMGYNENDNPTSSSIYQDANVKNTHAKNAISINNNTNTKTRTLQNAINSNNIASKGYNGLYNGEPSQEWDQNAGGVSITTGYQSYWSYSFKTPQNISAIEIISRLGSYANYANNLYVQLHNGTDADGFVAQGFFKTTGNSKDDAHRVFIVGGVSIDYQIGNENPAVKPFYFTSKYWKDTRIPKIVYQMYNTNDPPPDMSSINFSYIWFWDSPINLNNFGSGINGYNDLALRLSNYSNKLKIYRYLAICRTSSSSNNFYVAFGHTLPITLSSATNAIIDSSTNPDDYSSAINPFVPNSALRNGLNTAEPHYITAGYKADDGVKPVHTYNGISGTTYAIYDLYPSLPEWTGKIVMVYQGEGNNAPPDLLANTNSSNPNRYLYSWDLPNNPDSTFHTNILSFTDLANRINNNSDAKKYRYVAVSSYICFGNMLPDDGFNIPLNTINDKDNTNKDRIMGATMNPPPGNGILSGYKNIQLKNKIELL